MNSNNEYKIIYDILYNNQEKNDNTFTIIEGFREENDNMNEELNNNNLLDKEQDYSKYPFNLIQEIEIQFSFSKKPLIYNSFIIYNNILLTISKNVYSIQRKLYINKLKLPNLNLEFCSDDDNYNSENTFHIFLEDNENENSLAMIIFNKEISNEYFGIIDSEFLLEEEEQINGFLICKNRFSEKRNLNIKNIIVESNSFIEEIKKLKEENIENKNLNYKKKKEESKNIKELNYENENEEILSFIGSPIIRKLFEGNYYVIGLIDSNLKVRRIKEDDFKFIYHTYKKAFLFLKENNKGIEEDEIKNLDLSHKMYLSKKNSNFFQKISLISLNKVQSIDISFSKINDDCLKYFSKGNYFSLKELNLSNNLITENGIKFLTECTFRNVKILNLKNNQIKSKGIYYLTQCCFANQLYILNLNNNEINDEGINYLENNNFSILYKLYLNNNYITNDSIKYFEKINLNNLKFLFLFNNKLFNDENLIKKIQLKFPLISIFAGKNNKIKFKIFSYMYSNVTELFQKSEFPINLDEENIIINLRIIQVSNLQKDFNNKLKQYNECIGGIFLYEVSNVKLLEIKKEFNCLKNLHNLRTFKTMLLGNDNGEGRNVDFNDILNVTDNYFSYVKEIDFSKYGSKEINSLLCEFSLKVFDSFSLNKTSLKY